MISKTNAEIDKVIPIPKIKKAGERSDKDRGLILV